MPLIQHVGIVTSAFCFVGTMALADEQPPSLSDDILSETTRSCLESFARIAVDDANIEPRWEPHPVYNGIGNRSLSAVSVDGDLRRWAQYDFENQQVEITSRVEYTSPPSGYAQTTVPPFTAALQDIAITNSTIRGEWVTDDMVEMAEHGVQIMLDATQACRVFEIVMP